MNMATGWYIRKNNIISGFYFFGKRHLRTPPFRVITLLNGQMSGISMNFRYPPTKAAGTWHATASIDTGDWQGIVTTTENFEVKAAIANDNIANARTITLTNNAFTVTNLDTRGATVEVTEPSYNCNWGTSGSVWYKFTPTSNRNLLDRYSRVKLPTFHFNFQK